MLVDDILIEIGEMGTYQIIMYILLGLAGLPTGWQNMGITFVGANIDHWCSIPRLNNLTSKQQKYIAIPDDTDNSYSQCDMFDIDYDHLTDEDINSWNRSLFPKTKTIRCQHGWVYDKSIFTSSLVSQFGLVCDKSSNLFMIQTIYMCGFLTGCVVFGQLADRIGRHKTLLIALMVEILFATGATFVPYYSAYVSLRFVVGAAAAGSFTTVFIMCVEMAGPRFRLSLGVFIQAWFAVGLMTMPAMSYFVRNHIHLQLICALVPIIPWLSLFLVDESPRWLISNGFDEKAMILLAKIAKLNGRKLPNNMNLADNRKHSIYCTTCVPRLIEKLFPGLGVDLLPGSLFLNSFLQAAIELPSYVIIILAMQYLGRKLPGFITLVATGICCLLLTPFLDNTDLQGGATAFLLIGKFFVSATFALIYVYSAELFPTVVREVAVGSSSTCARIGSLLQPQIRLLQSKLWNPAAFFVYGIFAIVGGIMCIFLPETLGQILPETMEDGEIFARSAKINFKTTISRPLETKDSNDVKESEQFLPESRDNKPNQTTINEEADATDILYNRN
ncbi:hypothetical protein LSH36_500g01035 [Paralvinella palmiformis]|uniref:Major facilitator superfamily (MFS) profile domain-containing protein n=1 Tax=Paralvinella palmiformis TaxID=53620 RepID=A0AAD9MWJ4_9ANNE|nr:hypothetical protein LSH36_500g01035 [Paralvinella palmiformis]